MENPPPSREEVNSSSPPQKSSPLPSKSPWLLKSHISPSQHSLRLVVSFKTNLSYSSPTIQSSPSHSPSPYYSYENPPLSPKSQASLSSPLRRTSVSPCHAPSNPPIINLDLEHLNLNVPIVNLSKSEVKLEKGTNNATSFNPDLSLIVYLRHSYRHECRRDEFSERTQSKDEAPVENEGEFHKLLYNIIVESEKTMR